MAYQSSWDSQGIVSTILLIFLPLIFFTFKKLIKSQAPPLPPGPKSWSLISTTMNHTNYLHLANLSQTYGPLMHFSLGTQRLIVASSPAAAAEILKTNDRVLSGRATPHAVPKTPAQTDTLSFWADTTSQHWKNLRAVTRTELFTAKALERCARVREEKAAEMVAEMRKKGGAVANVEQMVFAAVVNMSSNVYFSRDVEVGDQNPMSEILLGIGGIFATANLSDSFPFLGVLDVQGLRRRYMELSMKMWELWKPIVKERRELSELRQQDFLDYLICKGFGDDQINHLLEDLFSGGIHTTTLTIKKTMMELLQSPQTINKLKQELDAALDGQDPITASHIENLPYLQACIKETLRLHPPAVLTLPHRAYASCSVMGYTIPKNAQILVNLWAIGRDPTAWEEPSQYQPERFLISAVDFKGNDFEFLPFSAGRRICPGMIMAAKIVSLLVAELVYFFDWSLPHGITDVNEIWDRATSEMKGPLLLIPTLRK